jgi:hypothetical protein
MCLVSGMVYPAFCLVYALGIQGFSQLEASGRRFQGDWNALWQVLLVKCLFFGYLRPAVP